IQDYSEAIRLNPDSANRYNALAWLLATCPKEKIRDGRRAVELATKACGLSNWKNAYHLRNLSAAHAQGGNFNEAVKGGQMEINLGFDDKEDMEAVRKKLKLHQQGKPYRE